MITKLEILTDRTCPSCLYTVVRLAAVSKSNVQWEKVGD